MLSAIVGTFSLAFIVAYLLTGIVRRHALRTGLIDVPNHRSSHVVATPRGGGLAIAVVLIAFILALGLLQYVPMRLVLAFIGGGTLVAAVGWMDDRHGLSARLRLTMHLAAAGWAVWWLGGFTVLRVGTWELPLGFSGSILAVLGVAWAVNLYNFMDGIDGLAAGQALVAGLGAGIIALGTGHLTIALVSLLVAGASAGFLGWNWPPAKIFMGDVSSGLLGYWFAVLALASDLSGSLNLLGWGTLLAVFAVDASATLLRRILQRENWMEAHRTHAYQLFVASGLSHRTVTVTALAFGVLLVLLAWLSNRWLVLQVPLSLAGVFLLLTMWMYSRTRYRRKALRGGKVAS